MHLTPTYHVFDMMRPHMGARLLTDEVECPQFEAHPVGLKRKCPVPALSVSASLTGKKVLLTVANQTVDQDVITRIDLHGARIAGVAGRILNAANPRAFNTFENPKTVYPKRLKLDADSKEWVHTFPAHSFTALTISLG